MTNTFARWVAVAALLMSAAFAANPAHAAAAGAPLEHAGTDVSDRASLQRGAALYMNYCAACHSLQFMRYSRIAEDLGLTEEQVMENLNFTGAEYGRQVGRAMTKAQGTEFFGKDPPDLSVITRVRGTDWIYTYLKSFYLDDTAAMGWNNPILVNASMPNPLWELQGVQHAEYGAPDEAGDRTVERLVVTQPGTQTPEQFDQTVRDITTFLEYVGEPVIVKRQQLGVWVIFFLVLLSGLAWLLKKEYWRDVH